VGEARYVPKTTIQMTTVLDYRSDRHGYAVKRSERNVRAGVSLLEGSILIGVLTDIYSWRYGVVFDVVIVIHFLSLP